jgi:uncharacterized protein YlxW (UPF0749 family)
MTFVGKILVIVIMVFALFFLAVSTVVFSTAKNWKDETTKLKKSVSDLQKKVSDANNDAAKRGEELKSAQADFKKQTDTLEGQIKTLNEQVASRQKELTEQRTTVETSQETTKTALTEADARKRETDLLREQLSAVRKQADEFKIAQTNLNDEIRILKRQLESATINNKQLREDVATYSSVIRSNGLSDDIRQIRGVQSSPPDVEGEVTRVDVSNKRVEISIGSDDQLVVGHQLEVFRMKPNPEYIGKIRIESVEGDQAVGVVIGNTLHGKKIQEGDIVSPKIRPRS